MTAGRRTGLLLAIAFSVACTKADLGRDSGTGGSGGAMVVEGGSGGAPGTGGVDEDAPVADDADAEPMDVPAEVADDSGLDQGLDAEGEVGDVGGDALDGSGDGGPTGVMPSMPGQVLVSELMPNTAALADDIGEWVEIYNPSTTVTYDLKDCALTDNAVPPNRAPITTPFIMTPGSYHTIARMTPAFTPDFVQTAVKFGNDHFDGAAIVCNNIQITNFTYQPIDVQEGHSLSVDPDHLNVNDYTLPGNWCSSKVAYYTAGGATDFGTPGKVNPHCPAGM